MDPVKKKINLSHPDPEGKLTRIRMEYPDPPHSQMHLVEFLKRIRVDVIQFWERGEFKLTLSHLLLILDGNSEHVEQGKQNFSVEKSDL